MAISAVLPNISFGRRGVDSRTAFVEKQHAGQDLLAGTWTTQANLFGQQATALEINVNTKEAQAATSATNAATSAATATAAANRAQSVVIPTTAAYAIATQDWRDTMMSKAEFNAVAAERRANRAGSGFDEFGKHYSVAGFNVNEGFWTYNTDTYQNKFMLGRESVATAGLSKTELPFIAINGAICKLSKIASSATYEPNYILLPPAPTVLPSTATLTQQQIDSGVIKHADASNSGLIVNGKFDTDTSGWTAGSSAILSIDTNRLKITNTVAFGAATQSFATVIGKKYIIECVSTLGTATRSVIGAGNSAADAINSTLGYHISTSGGYQKLEFTAIATLSYMAVGMDASTTSTLFFDNIAVFPADAISRSDLPFIESWHEDVSEKDFVYPLGNVQYLGTTGDSGTPVAGAFAGAVTYSLFSDTWQADSALVGKGYVWSTLSDANKKAFVANPENNCYLDGDKVIQVRYRMRVVMGLGDSWTNVEPQTTLTLQSGTSAYITAKGKQVSVLDLGAAGHYAGALSTATDSTKSIGSFSYRTGFGILPSYVPLETFALPIALVHRRNQGMMHPVYNPNGTKLASDSLPWYSTTVSFTSIADCFTDSKLLANSGSIASGVSGRPE